MDSDSDTVGMLVEAIRPILAGHPPQVQGAALADLLAIWLAGHPGEVRDDLLWMHLTTMHKLIPVNEAMIADRTRPSRVSGGAGSNELP